MTSNGRHSRRGSGPSRRLIGVAVAAAALAVAGAVPALATAAGPESTAAATGPAAPGLVALPGQPGQEQPPPDDSGTDPAEDPDPATEPSDDEPATDPPADDPPADDPPADDEPADDEPADEPAPADEPVDEPADEDPADEDPADQDPADEDPADEPADEDPADEDPADEDPAAAGEAMPAITVEGNQIMRNGEPWWFLGYNSFVWSGDCGNDDEKMTEADVEEWFAGMRHDGHGAVRLFFYDGWNVDRLDAAVESAKKHNIYLTITLDDAIGGCGENDKDSNWFADQSERDTFRNHMTDMLERYKGETAFAWFEYFNEPSYEDGALREFYDEMGAEADTIDPDRLFSSGTVAPYWLDGEDNFLDVHESPGVDIASLHEYDEGEIESNHGPGVRANSAGKPVIVGEYGITAGDGCDSSYASRADRFAQKAQAYTNTDDGYAGALAWAWQPGGGGCELGNLDSDTASQDALREFGGRG